MSQQTSPDQAGPPEAAASRRVVLTGVGVAALAALTGCATYDSSAPAGNAGAGRASNAGTPDDADPSADAGAGDALAQTADVPVGGGTVIDQQKIVITQPKKGTFKAFTAVCTHQGCVVADVTGGTINCPCHGSKFHIADGSVANGPASRPLRQIDIKVDGTGITLA